MKKILVLFLVIILVFATGFLTVAADKTKNIEPTAFTEDGHHLEGEDMKAVDNEQVKVTVDPIHVTK